LAGDAQKILEFTETAFTSEQPRGDYEEFLTLTLVRPRGGIFPPQAYFLQIKRLFFFIFLLGLNDIVEKGFLHMHTKFHINPTIFTRFTADLLAGV